MIDTTLLLVNASDGRPKQAHLRRAVSTTYYALFHCLATCCADSIAGGPGSRRGYRAWRHAYRALEHGHAKNQCNAALAINFPDAIKAFATHFVAMQKKRHDADYDPYEKFAKSTVATDAVIAVSVIRDFLKAPMKDRRAFATWVLLKMPKQN